MSPRSLAILVLVLGLGLAGANGAEKSPYDNYVSNSLSFTSLGLGTGSDLRINELKADRTNRVWVATNGGISAVMIESLAQFFPLNRTSDRLLDMDVTAIAFGTLGTAENFFVGFNNGTKPTGIQYGRMLSDTGLDPAFQTNLLLRSGSEDSIIALSSDRESNLWAATPVGLVTWTIGGAKTKPESVTNVVLKDHSISHVLTDPWAATAPKTIYASDKSLYLFPSEQEFDLTTDPVSSLAFNRNGDLWVASGRTITRFKPSNDANQQPFVNPVSFAFNDSTVSLRTLRNIAVDPVAKVLWVGTDRGAYFQSIDPVTQDLTGGWKLAETTQFDNGTLVYADPSGNIWFGTDFGVRSLLGRLITIDFGHFVGYGATVTVNLLDANPVDLDKATVVVVPKGGDISKPLATFTASRQAGRSTFSIGFATTAQPGKLPVSSSTAEVTYQVVYVDSNGNDLKLPRPEFTWANVVPFQDDLLIGGPCFVKALGL